MTDPTARLQELVLLLMRAGVLVLLWLFVLYAARAIRRDLFAGRVRPAPVRAAPAAPKASKAQRKALPRKVVVTAGPLTGTNVTLGADAVTIGRADDSTLVLDDTYASTRHARLVQRDGQWYVEDLGSTNGTYLDRTRVTGPMPVPVGVPIRIGKTALELRR
ncbi:MAG: hypothetical protein QOF57_2247 [Frankiaceae bacterium]|jgi:hypothetical protein|nr:hypothetical protein [Frankiaceae bacterium]